MSESSVRKVPVWMAGISAAIIVVMAAMLFAQVRLIAEQNHNLMIDNQNLEIEIESLKTSFNNEGSRVVAKLDAGLPLGAIGRSSALNIAEELEGSIIGALVRQVQDERPYVQFNGLNGLTKVVPAEDRQAIFAPMVVPVVIPKVKDERVRDVAIGVLNQYRPYAAAAAPTILESSETTSYPYVRYSVSMARGLDPKCDYMSLLVRYVQESEEDWKSTLVQIQAGYTDEEVQQAYQRALEQTSDEQQRTRFAGILRYLKERPPASSLQLPRDVEEYVRQGAP